MSLIPWLMIMVGALFIWAGWNDKSPLAAIKEALGNG